LADIFALQHNKSHISTSQQQQQPQQLQKTNIEQLTFDSGVVDEFGFFSNRCGDVTSAARAELVVVVVVVVGGGLKDSSFGNDRRCFQLKHYYWH
jgi:hypothetical protein